MLAKTNNEPWESPLLCFPLLKITYHETVLKVLFQQSSACYREKFFLLFTCLKWGEEENSLITKIIVDSPSCIRGFFKSGFYVYGSKGWRAGAELGCIKKNRTAAVHWSLCDVALGLQT